MAGGQATRPSLQPTPLGSPPRPSVRRAPLSHPPGQRGLTHAASRTPAPAPVPLRRCAPRARAPSARPVAVPAGGKGRVLAARFSTQTLEARRSPHERQRAWTRHLQQPAVGAARQAARTHRYAAPPVLDPLAFVSSACPLSSPLPLSAFRPWRSGWRRWQRCWRRRCLGASSRATRGGRRAARVAAQRVRSPLLGRQRHRPAPASAAAHASPGLRHQKTVWTETARREDSPMACDRSRSGAQPPPPGAPASPQAVMAVSRPRSSALASRATEQRRPSVRQAQTS
jgi:hypothetical protein